MKRVRRWVLPVTGVMAAVAGLVSLFGSELLSDQERKLAPLPRASLARVAAVRRPAAVERRPAIEVAPAPAALTYQAISPPSASHQIVLPPIPASRFPVHETPAVLAATGSLADLAMAKTLQDRLKLIDEMKAGLGPDEAVSKFEGLIDSDLPGSFYDAETLRLYLLARLGELPGASADAALVARIEPNVPRPERLVAIDMLAARSPAGRDALAAIAQSDHDVVVQDKARWALAQAQ